ncbi:unnamed protein product [Moneuplotes crassus]|uniref:CoA carboxyltransferase C-terminal domain-containing protein n=1 Tax=Euplotes crassus TaxID=5936 RepID=A0AAD1UBN4_EUPCR|nr:unnamed protein product [Moneuplotes crassus]
MSNFKFGRATSEIQCRYSIGRRAKKDNKKRVDHKLTVRERLDLLFDEGTFTEYDRYVVHKCNDFGIKKQKFDTDRVVTGHEKSMEELSMLSHKTSLFSEKVSKIKSQAMLVGARIIEENDSGSAKIQEGVLSLARYAEIFQRNVNSSGVIPQVLLIMGPCAGGAVTKSSVVIRNFKRYQAIASTRNLMSYLPSSNDELPPRREWALEDEANQASPDILNNIIPDDLNKHIIRSWCSKVVCMMLGYRFLDCRSEICLCMCCFNIRGVIFEDVPGFLSGTNQEYGGIIKHGAKLLYAFTECTTPKITDITRKGYRGAFDVMSCKRLSRDMSYAWPTAEISAMRAKGVVEIIFRCQNV